MFYLLLFVLLAFSSNVLAADQKISARSVASTLDGTETIPVIQGGNDRKTTLGAQFASSTLTCTNQVLRLLSTSLTGTCVTITSAYADGSIAKVGTANSWTAGVKQTFAPNATNAGFNTGSASAAPSSPVNGDIYYDSALTLFQVYENGGWRGLGIAAELLDLQGTFALGKSITGANSRANAFRFGDGVTPMCGYTDATLGPMIRGCTDANTLSVIASTFTYKIWDEAGALSMEDIKPSGATTALMWTYPNATYRPKKQIYFPAGSLSVDGTQCSAPSEVTINSGAKRWTIVCADNDSSTIYGEVEMPDSWDGGTVTLMGTFIQTAANTSAINADIAMACRVNGDTVNNTWGTEIPMDIANLGGSNKINTATTSAITPNGTCTGAGTMLQFRYQVDAAGSTTAMGTLHHLGFKLTYSEKSRSS